MSGNKWSVERTIKFLEIYEQHPCLWDIRLDSYKSREVRRDAYEKIAKAMALDDFGVLDVRSKIRTLRNSYTLELAKLLKLKRSNLSDETFKSRLAWFPVAERFFSKVARSQSTEMITYTEGDIRNDSRLHFVLNTFLAFAKYCVDFLTRNLDTDDTRLLSENKNPIDINYTNIGPSTSLPYPKDERSSATMPPLPQERSSGSLPQPAHQRSSGSLPPPTQQRSSGSLPPPVQEKSSIILAAQSLDKPPREDNEIEYHSMTTKTSSVFNKDDFDIFGAFVASELRGLDNSAVVKMAKKKIQTAILEAYEASGPVTVTTAVLETIYEQQTTKGTQTIEIESSQIESEYNDDDPMFSAIKCSIVADVTNE